MSQPDAPIRIAFFGSGGFGLPTLEHLKAQASVYEIALVVSQPDRPAGRKRRLTPTPIAQWATERGIDTLKPANVNEPAIVQQVRALAPEVLVVIAFGQKIGRPLMADLLAINLHGSLLPAYRGAAPIQRAMMDGCTTTGVSVITLADRMDAGDLLATASTPIRADETAGELHDRLALLGPEAITGVLTAFRNGTLHPEPQDDSRATAAAKLTKQDGTTSFDQPASRVRARIHGLNPWPGCAVQLEATPVRLARVRDWPDEPHAAPPGTVLANLHVACSAGAIEIVELQPEGSRTMSLAEYRNGRSFEPNMQITPRIGGA